MKQYLFILFLISLAYCTHAQSVTWEKQFHFERYTSGGPAVETSDGGYLISTSIENDSTGSLWIVKLNKNGDFQWRKIIDTADGEVYSFIRKDKYLYAMVVYGNTYDTLFQTWANDFTIIDFNENGDVLWTKRQSSIVDKYTIIELLSLGNGNYVTQGFLGNSLKNPQSAVMVIQKYNGQHQVTWSDTFNFAPFTDGFGPLLETRDHKIIIGGNAGGGGIFNKFSFVLALDSEGRKINYVQYPYVADSSEQVDYICQRGDGKILVATSADANAEIYLNLADSVGNRLRRWEIDNVVPRGISGLVPDGDSVFVSAQLSLLPFAPISVLKLDTGYNLLWQKDYDDTSGFANGAGLMRTSDNGLLLTGTRTWVGAPAYNDQWSDMMAIKLDSQGNLAKTNYSGINNQPPNSAVSVYPNPATDNLYINTQNSNSILNLDIFDSRGRAVAHITGLAPGTRQIDIGSFGNGLYFYRLYDANKVYCEGKFVKG